MKIQTKLLALLLPFVLLPLLVVGWSNYTGVREEIRASFRTEAESQLELIAHHMGAIIRSAMASAQQLQASLVVQTYAAEPDRQLRAFLLQPSLITSFRSHTQNQPEYLKIAYVNRENQEEVKVGAGRWRDSAAMLSALRRDLRDDGKPAIVFHPDLEGDPLLIVEAPLRSGARSSSGTSRGGNFLIIQLALDGIREQMEMFATRYGYIALIGSDDTTLIEAGSADRTASDDLLVMEHELPQLAPPGFNVLVEADPSAVDQRVQKAFFRALAYTLVAVLAASLMLYHVLHRLVVGPIRNLTSATETISAGDLDIELPYRSNDELGELAESVRNMATELKNSRAQADYLAYHDHLTGLPNRRFFLSSLDNAVQRAERHGTKLAMLFLDLDDFKQINDVHGHDVGDKLLIAFGHRLMQSVRGEDLMGITALSRIGGDEFFVLLDPVETPVDAATVAERLVSSLKIPIVAAGLEFTISASIGIASCPEDSTTAQQLIRHADIALYHAKNQGKNNYQFYCDRLNVAARRRATVAAGLRHAVRRDELTLLYQPKIALRHGRIAGAEALLRWNSPELGDVLPGEFIPVAVEIGAIREIGAWVIRKARADCLDATREGNPEFKVAVNVSAAQMRTPEALDELFRALRDLGTDKALFEIEITESEVMENPESYADSLREFAALGVSIALDDFGTGYSSFSYLRKLPIDVLKIDRSLIDGLPNNHDAAAIIITILAMARNLGLKIVAEGVETQAQAEFLKREGCDYVQGFYYHKPMPRDELVRLLETQEGETGKRPSELPRA